MPGQSSAGGGLSPLRGLSWFPSGFRLGPNVQKCQIEPQLSQCAWVIPSFRFALTDVIREVPLTGGGTVPIQFEFSDFVHRPEGPVNQPRPPVAS